MLEAITIWLLSLFHSYVEERVQLKYTCGLLLWTPRQIFSSTLDLTWVAQILLIGEPWPEIRASMGSRDWKLILVQFYLWTRNRFTPIVSLYVSQYSSFFVTSSFVAFSVTCNQKNSHLLISFIWAISLVFYSHIFSLWMILRNSILWFSSKQLTKIWRRKMIRPTAISQPFNQSVHIY